MHSRPVVIGIIGVSFFVIAGVLVFSDLSSRGVPSSEQCAALWNDSSNAGNRSIAAGWKFDVAIVSGWLAKERFPGCGVLFLRSDGKPWLSFSGWLHQGRVDTWDLVSGIAWRSDSPEGGPENSNGIVTDWGRVRLEGSTPAPRGEPAVQAMNSTRSAWPTIMSACRIAVSSADGSAASR